MVLRALASQSRKQWGREGMNVVITDISTETLAHAQAGLSDQGITVLALTADVRKEADWQRVVEATIAQFGAIHGLMNNAGVGGGAQAVPLKSTPLKIGAGPSMSI